MDTAFGSWLRREIENRLHTFTRFAEIVGVNRDTLHSWISGHSTPRGVNIARLSNALGIDRTVIEEKIGGTVAA